MSKIECISREQLIEFLDGRLNDEQSSKVETHIDACQTCQTQVEAVQDVAPSREIQFDEQEAGFAAEPQCAQALQQIRALPESSVEQPQQRNSEVDLLASLPNSIGPYELVEPIGQGGMGVVFLARHSKLKRMVAIKLLSPLWPPTAELIARFEREMEAVGKLDHPNIVRASDAGEIEGMHYLVMEMVDGIDVSRLARNTDQMPVADACEIIRQAAFGLQSAHEEKLVHRDIKPSNLMVTRDGQVKVLDMGLALLGDFENQRELTSVGQFMGTIEYMSPEQCDNSHEVDIRGDVYSLGATLYRLLTGKPPFAKEDYNSLFKRVAAISTEDAPDVRTHRPGVHSDLAAVIARMLSRDPRKRYQTPADVADALTPWCDEADLPSLVASATSEVDESNQVRVVRPENRNGTDESSLRSEKQNTNKRRSWMPWLWLALGLFLLASFIYGLMRWTDKGQIAISTEENGVDLVIRRNSEQVRDLRLNEQGYASSLWSGDYTVEVEQSDLFELSQSAFTVNRGQQVEIEVRRKSPSLAISDLGSGTEDGVEPETSAADLGFASNVRDENARDETSFRADGGDSTTEPEMGLANETRSESEEKFGGGDSSVPDMVISSEDPFGESDLPMLNEPGRNPNSNSKVTATSPATTAFEEISATEDLASKADLIRSIGGMKIDGEEKLVAENLFEVMRDFDTFAPNKNERAVVVESITTFNALDPAQWRDTAITQLRSGTDNQQLFAARLLHESLAKAPLAKEDNQFAELSQLVDNPSSKMDVRLRAARYGLAGQMRFERERLETQLKAESAPEARSVLAQILASRNEYSKEVVAALGEQLSQRSNAAMPFAPANPQQAALAYLSQAPQDVLPSAANELADHFSSVVSKWDQANRADSDREKRSAEQELMAVLPLLQRLGRNAKPAESALQDFRNRKLENKDLRDAARDAWSAIKGE